MKKKLSISSLGNIKKPERKEPTPTKKPAAKKKTAEKKQAPKKSRGRPSERTAYVQLNTRIQLSTSQKIDDLVASRGVTMREVIEQAIDDMYNK